MENNKDRYIAVSYKLYTVDGDQVSLVEEAPADKPFSFLSGFGLTIDAFEREVAGLNEGDTFNFTLLPSEAYGEHLADRVLDLEKEIFTVNGHFDHDNIFVDAIVPLQNEDGHRFNGRVLEITDDIVKMDLNHPLAGKTLNFKGSVVEAREATKEEIQEMINRISGDDSCSGGCCGGGCGHHDHDHEHSCGCGH